MQPWTIKPLDWRGASENEHTALHQFMESMREELWPGDAPLPLDAAIRGWRTTPSFLEIESFAAWLPDDTIVGHGRVTFRHAEDNQHVVEIELGVLPNYRQLGIGRALLARLVEMPQRDGRRLMLAWTTDRVPSGEA